MEGFQKKLWKIPLSVLTPPPRRGKYKVFFCETRPFFEHFLKKVYFHPLREGPKSSEPQNFAKVCKWFFKKFMQCGVQICKRNFKILLPKIPPERLKNFWELVKFHQKVSLNQFLMKNFFL